MNESDTEQKTHAEAMLAQSVEVVRERIASLVAGVLIDPEAADVDYKEIPGGAAVIFPDNSQQRFVVRIAPPEENA